MLILLLNSDSGPAADTTAPVVSITPVAGLYASPVTVTLAADEPATIYYTLDVTDPDDQSSVYVEPLVIDTATVIKFFGVDTALNASSIQTASFVTYISPQDQPLPDWQDSNSVPAPGQSGSWGSSLPPVASNPDALPPLYGLTAYNITLNGNDITDQVESLTITETESSIFAVCSFDLPIGVTIAQNDLIEVTIDAVDRAYLVEEIDAEGPRRSVWCRSAAAVLDEPHAADVNYNGWDTPHATAAALAATIAGAVDLSFELPDWNLPPTWELSGSPIECLQSLAQAVGGVVQSTPSGGLVIRRRWPVRPVEMSALDPDLTVTRDVALSLSAKEQAGKGFGSVTVYGYDPSSALPDLELEETRPRPGDTTHVRVFWKTASRPLFSAFITEGAAAKISDGTTTITEEEVTFDQGSGSTRYPIGQLLSYRWLGNDQGSIWWLADGDSRELAMANTEGRGIALVTYSTAYERWQLTGQTAAKVMFGVDLGEGQVSAIVNYSSGGSLAPALTVPLLNDTDSCIEAGTAFLDTNRALQIVSAELPLTAAPLLPGSTVAVLDEVTQAVGIGKLTSISTTLAATKTTIKIEVQLCH